MSRARISFPWLPETVNIHDAVSGFGQVFRVFFSREFARRSWLWASGEEASTYGQHRRIPLHARKKPLVPRVESSLSEVKHIT